MSLSSGTAKLLLFKRGNGASPEVFTTVSESAEISGFGAKNPLVEATHFESTAKEYLSGLPDGAEFTVKCNFLPNHATQGAAAGMLYDQANGTLRDFRIYFPTGVDGGIVAHFSALVLGFDISASPDAVVPITFSLKISGSIWWSAS